MFIFHPTQRLGKIPKILALCETGQLRLAPALIWKSGERPALFAGTVAIDTTPAETNGSAPGTPPAVVGQPAPEGQETPPWECPRSDTALPTAAPPVPDVMEDMLAMVGLDGTADMGEGERSEENKSEIQSLIRLSYAVIR